MTLPPDLPLLRAAGPAPGVSVVIGTYRGAATIGATLRSLAEQTLAADRFEVVVVQNGPPDDTQDVLAEVRRLHPRLLLRSLRHGPPRLGRARNAGMAMARGSYVTFVDDDDTVSARYLEALLECCGPGTVGVAYLAELAAPGAAPEFGSLRFVPQLLRSGETISPEELFVPLTYSVGKLMPTPLARAVGFDPDLRSGEDIDFYARLFTQFPLNLRLTPIDAYATYYRVLVPDSLARQKPSFDFSVDQRLDIVERLEAVRPTQAWHRRLLDSRTRAEFRVTNRFLRECPERHADVLAEIRRRQIATTPYGTLNAGLARHLEIAYAGPPYALATAVPAALRVRESGSPVDVVAADLASAGPMDRAAGMVWRPFVDKVIRIPGAAGQGGGPSVAEFCLRGLEFVAQREEEKGPYVGVRSHTYAAAHLLAACCKARNPALEWVADLGGADRPDGAPPGRLVADAPALLGELRSALEAAGFPAPAGDDPRGLADALVGVLADRIVFADDIGRRLFLGGLGDRSLARRAEERAVLRPEPAPPAELYGMAGTQREMGSDAVQVGALGGLVSGPALADLTCALARLAPDERARVRLVTQRPAHYLDLLDLLARLDVVVLTLPRSEVDAAGTYPPAGFPAVAGSGTPVWGILGPGAATEGLPLAQVSDLGDVGAAEAVLRKLLASAR